MNLRTEDDLNVLKIYTLYIDAKLIMMFEKLNNLFWQSQNSLSNHKFKQCHKIAEIFTFTTEPYNCVLSLAAHDIT